MKNTSDVIGIDISKLKIDACHYHSSKPQTFTNEAKGFNKLIKWLKPLIKDNYFVCFENTGYYSLALAVFLEQKQIAYCMVAPIQIKRSLGLVRGKTDQSDAYQIARYAWLHRQELEPSVLPAKLIMELSQILSLREQFVKQKVSLQNMLEAFGQGANMSSTEVIKLLKQQVKQLLKQILKTEKAIDTLLQKTELKPNYKLLLSIVGVGRILAAQLIVHTKNFTSFANWRKFACYAGIAPFEHTSGTSIKGRTRVHHIADKKLKSLLNMAALSAIRHDPELKMYYKHKVEQEKNKMSVINAVRCKIVARAFAVVKRQTPYLILSKFAA